MPPKRKPSTLLKKENKLLVTRLMQISLEVDKHVYKNKPISVTAARDYITELAQLRNQGGQDARTMQVIEKLTRQMKSIIIDNENTFVPSMHQDITELQPLDVQHSPIDKANINKHMQIDGVNTLTNNMITYNMNDNEIANEYTNTTKENAGKTNTISNMNLENCDTPTSLDSQSILANTAADFINHNIEHDKLNSKMAAKIKPKFLPPKKSLKLDKNKTNMATLCTSDYSNTPNVIFEINSQSILGDATQIEKPIIPKDKGTKKTKTQKQDNVKTKKINKKKDIKETSKERKKENILKKRQKGKNINKNVPTDVNISVTEIETTEKAVTNNKELNYFNNNNCVKTVQEDLSWIENIKYVREVTMDELIPNAAAANENFWENISFAGQIHSEDFL